ncbi:MAG TPA: tetratricopeptide repeat protein [Candidatus Cloacimonadota bacterium]|nr:tetratricopeptide repeat protein [Candidatus Cloacimonadota bacterium]
MGTIFNYIAQAKYLASRNWILAVNVLENAIEENPEEAILHAELAEIFISKNEFNKAIKYLKEAIRLDTKNEHFIFKLGNCYVSQKKHAKAIQTYNGIKTFIPEAIFNKAVAYNTLGKYDKAQECLDLLIEKKADIDAVYVLSFENLLMAEDFERLQNYVEPMRSRIGEHPEFNYLVGQYYYGKKNYIAAYSEFLKAKEKNYYTDVLSHFFALTAFEIGKVQQALEILDQGIKDFPDFDFLIYDRIRINLLLKNKRKANADLKRLKNKNSHITKDAEMLFFSYNILK